MMKRLIIILLASSTCVHAENWNRFRGPQGRGHAGTVALPVNWSEENIAWRAELPGAGQSCPVNWGDKIFLTAASDEGRIRHVICLNKADGKRIWMRDLVSKAPEKPHKMNTWATPTCATDGKHVVAFFGPAGLHCYDMDGEKRWSRDLGTFPGPFGIAASPIIIGDRVIQNGDAAGASFLAAFNLDSGEEVWRTPRAEKPRGGWSTPVLIDTGERDELLLNGEYGVRAYDPTSGKELWFCKAFNGRGSPVPEYAHGLVIAVSGKPGDVYAVKPNGTGDVTEQMVWHAPRKGGRDLPAPIVVNKHLFIVSLGGIATLYDARTGEVIWTERLDGRFSASPLEANGLIYVHNEAGTTLVIKPGPKLDLVATNIIGEHEDETFRAAASPIAGHFMLRSTRALYCITP